MQNDMESTGNDTSNLKAEPDVNNSIGIWQSWAVTDVGKLRQRNEDAILNKPEAGLWAVADGMGGHDAGDVASQMVIESLDNVDCEDDFEAIINKLDNCLQKVNRHLCELAELRHHRSIIGSTVVVFMAQQQRCAVLWAGDSRLYRLRDKQLRQMTRDHCPNYGKISDEWAIKTANEITRAVGADEQLELDHQISDVHQGDMFLLCSDGLDKELSLKEIEQVLLNNTDERIVDVLLETALQRGARDNISIILAIPGIQEGESSI